MVKAEPVFVSFNSDTGHVNEFANVCFPGGGATGIDGEK
jgi:hypothetical protein